MSETKSDKTTSGWFVARWLLGFFGVMVVANAIFVWFALSTHTGTQAQNPYEDGLNHNQVLEQARQQQLLGWSFRVDNMSDGSLLLSLFAKDGTPLADARVEALLFSPTSDKNDIDLSVKNMAEGQYLLSSDIWAHGSWQLRLKIDKAEDKAEFRRKLVLP